jgi:cytochrome c peroxidase
MSIDAVILATLLGAASARAAATTTATTAGATAATAVSPAAPPIARDVLPAELAHLTDEEVARIARMSPLPAVPADPSNRFAESEAAAEFGHALFFETRLSPKGVSCATCHDPARYFTDGKPLSVGIGTARRNAPTVVDAARRRWNGWDGKFDSLWSQALSPIEHPDEMGGDRVAMLRLVRDDASLRAGYERAFGPFPAALARGGGDPLAPGDSRDPAPKGAQVPAPEGAQDPAPEGAQDLAPKGAQNPAPKAAPAPAPTTARDTDAQRLIDATTAQVLKALGAYQRRLVSSTAPIDAFIEALGSRGERGSLDALEPAARRGLATFVSTGGCYQCHRGPSFTDEEFHALGLTGANGRVPDDPARLAAVDFVQANPFNAAGAFSDARDSSKASMVRGLRRSGELFGQFRTPALRGVALTAPFMHDGRFATLDDVIHFYDTLEGASPVGHHGEMVLEPLGLGEQGRADLVAFLRSLSPKLDDLGKWANPPVPPVRTAPEPTER